MRIIKDSITTLAREGRLTLQIPMYCIGLDSEPYEDCPDDWFCYLQSNGTPCVGKQEGFLYLTKAGYEANKEAIKTAFETAVANKMYDRTGGEGWPAFERYAQEHFAKVEKQKQRRVNELQKKLNQITSFNV